jgi:hypothetical protein
MPSTETKKKRSDIETLAADGSYIPEQYRSWKIIDIITWFSSGVAFKRGMILNSDSIYQVLPHLADQSRGVSAVPALQCCPFPVRIISTQKSWKTYATPNFSSGVLKPIRAVISTHAGFCIGQNRPSHRLRGSPRKPSSKVLLSRFSSRTRSCLATPYDRCARVK